MDPTTENEVKMAKLDRKQDKVKSGVECSGVPLKGLQLMKHIVAYKEKKLS